MLIPSHCISSLRPGDMVIALYPTLYPAPFPFREYRWRVIDYKGTIHRELTSPAYQSCIYQNRFETAHSVKIIKAR